MTCVVASAGLPPKPCFAEYHWCNSTSRCEANLQSVDRLDVFHKREEALGEGGVDVDGALEQRVRLFREHESAEDLHQLASFGGKDGSSQDAVIRSVHDELHKPHCFAALDGARHEGHRALADF